MNALEYIPHEKCASFQIIAVFHILKQLIFSRFFYHILDFDSANAISTHRKHIYTYKKKHLPFQAKPFALTIKYPCRNCTFALSYVNRALSIHTHTYSPSKNYYLCRSQNHILRISTRS